MRLRVFAGKKPRFGRRVYLAATAVVVGDVELADDVNVWYGAVLRGDLNHVFVGARSNIQDQVVIHVDTDAPTWVGEDVTVGHSAILHGCRVERGALVGMHATVLNGAVVGEEALVAAGALVPPGMHVPPGMLAAGVPAKVVRPLKPEERERIRAGLVHYLELKSRYLAEEDQERELEYLTDWEKLV
ncbi:MAG: gamma carbonic anhydrase family protein [Thermoanaerobaculum sp.]|nr:gamma carbonic anhydrase family protein [Thermoanaerobaculum sp.]MCX7894569.1 gamma carbonic anhydrase family protein [Thermoanaerobaculum sp.]MDW7966773.1 gamma carbonic anhydrase family protein [Thermoanaerobaculum sp.]